MKFMEILADFFFPVNVLYVDPWNKRKICEEGYKSTFVISSINFFIDLPFLNGLTRILVSVNGMVNYVPIIRYR